MTGTSYGIKSLSTLLSRKIMVHLESRIFISGFWAILAILFLVGSMDAQTQGQAAHEPEIPDHSIMEGSIDPNSYVVGPGDVLEIGIWGDLGRRFTAIVNPEGSLTVNPIGPIKVNGLLLSEVSQLITDELSKYYKKDIITISLIGVRVFTVHVVGWVENPGAVSASAVTRVSQVLSSAGWVSRGGSLRNILLIRKDRRIPVDLSRYLLLGDTSRNPFVTGGDIIFVPAAAGEVSILGEVNRPGSYEFVEGETLRDLVELAGGFKISAWLDTIEVQRFKDDDPTVSIPIYLRGDPAVIETFKLRIGDRLFIRMIPDFHDDPRVEIVGEVRYPGSYVIEEGVETITDLVKRAGGFTEKASLAEARLIRGTYQSRSFPIESELGVYQALEKGLTDREKDLLGSLSREPKGRVVVDLEKLFVAGDSSLDMKLYRGDRIEVPVASNLVRVSGQVENPGLVSFKKGLKVSDYIELAGGYARDADKSETRVIKAVGGQQVTARNVEIQPGDIIWVPRKPEKSKWQVAKDVANVLAQVATIYLVIDAIDRRD